MLLACGAEGDGRDVVGDPSATSSTTGTAETSNPVSSQTTATLPDATTEMPEDSSSTSSSNSSSGDANTDDCEIGRPDHCAACDDACPGTDSQTTERLCVDSTCDLHCLAEFYDLNGSPHDGCEAEDIPAQDTTATAVAFELPDVDDPTFMSNPLDHTAAIYGDDRVHDRPLTMRPLGREDRYAITAVGAGVGGGMMACLGITNFPADNMLEMCIGDPGDDEFASAACVTAQGGGESECASPPGGGDAGGPYPIRVRKLAGTNTDNGYALFLQH